MLREYYDDVKESLDQDERAAWAEALRDVYSGWDMDALRADYIERFTRWDLPPRAPPEWERPNLIEFLVKGDLDGDVDHLLDEDVQQEIHRMIERHEMILSVLWEVTGVEPPQFFKKVDALTKGQGFFQGDPRQA